MSHEQKTDERGNNLLVAVVMIVTFSALAAAATAMICSFVIESLNSSNTMALLITDNAIVSDDAKLENNLNSAMRGLVTCRDLACALFVGCVMVGLAATIRGLKK